MKQSGARAGPSVRKKTTHHDEVVSHEEQETSAMAPYVI